MNKYLHEKRQYSIFSTFICLVCFVTNISQMPYLVENSLTRFVAIPIWIVLGVVCIAKDHCLHISKIKNILVIAVLFAAYYVLAGLFNSSFYESALPYPIFLSMFILIIGTMAGRFIDTIDIKRICDFYIWSGIIVCANVYMKYIFGHSLSGITYLYTSKNSVSQILLTTWILIILLKLNKSGALRKVIYFLCMVLLTWTMLALKSRATIIGMLIAVIWIVSHGKYNKKARNILILLLVICVFLMLNENIYNFVINDILFAGRDVDSLDSLSSGRASEWTAFPHDFINNWFFGCGHAKRESVILTSLLEFGVLGGSMIFFLAITPFIWGIKRLPQNHSMFLTFTSLALVYLSNGVFEQLAPFGPGVKCYFLWFLFGLFTVERSKSCKSNVYN